MRLLPMCLLLIGCTQQPGIEEGAIYENLLTGDRIKIDRTGTCDPVKTEAAGRAMIADRYGEAFLVIADSMAKELDRVVDSVLTVNPGAPAFMDESVLDISDAIERLMLEYDTYKSIEDREAWDYRSNENTAIITALKEGMYDAGDQCAFTVKKGEYAIDIGVYSFKELRSDWRRLN